MEKIVEHGYYTYNEAGQYHSFDGKPAIVIESYEKETMEGEEKIIEQVGGYSAWYDGGVWLKTEYNNGDIFTNENIDGC